MSVISGNKKINKFFLGNKVVNKIFSGSKQVYPDESGVLSGAYIEPTTQVFVDTGVKLGGSDVVKIRYKRTTASSGWNPIYGVGANSGGELTYRIIANSTDSGNENVVQYGNWDYYTYHETVGVPSINKVIYNEFNPIESKWTIKIDTDTFEFPITLKQFNPSNFNAYVFCANDYGRYQYSAPFRLYEFEIVGKCHLVPMLKDNVTPALYDTIRGVWHTNNAFTYGVD